MALWQLNITFICCTWASLYLNYSKQFISKLLNISVMAFNTKTIILKGLFCFTGNDGSFPFTLTTEKMFMYD